ncbi:MAG TPA: 2-amino-4-hydroxy-6-hydroxymethyldihydropteridine diphosphokinase [Caulobacterales bacterium]|nr:2-amino-4-hydroxy-6-hydroxymethyldihydropteridine diphosphokinase [Caulobacterales bacterium]
MPNDQPRAFVALGTNLPFEGLAGAALLEHALARLSQRGLNVRAVSSAWRSRALPRGDQPDFVNAVAWVEAAQSPKEFYRELVAVEAAFGRTRGERWAARTLDLDIIDMAAPPGTYDGIIVPHPRLAERAFVLAPLAEIAPDWRHPITGKSVEELLEAVADQRLRRLGPLRLHVAQSRRDD